MDFYRIENHLLANLSLRNYFVNRKSKTFFVLVFLENLPSLPNVGVSLFPADFLHLHRLSPSNTVAFQPWENMQLDWHHLEVRKYSFLKVSVVFKDEHIGLQFQFEPSSVSSGLRFYSYPPEFNEAYLSIAGNGLIDRTGKCSLALLDANQFMNYLKSKASYLSQNVEINHVNRNFDVRDCCAGTSSKENFSKKPELSSGDQFQERDFTGLEAVRSWPERRYNSSKKTGSNPSNFESSAGITTKFEPTSSSVAENKHRRREFIASNAKEFFKNGSDISFSSEIPSVSSKKGGKKAKTVAKAVEKEYTDEEDEFDETSEDSPNETHESDSAVDKELKSTTCAICHERQIEVIFLPCRHASICKVCHAAYVTMERKKQVSVFSNKPHREEEVTCLLCREKIEMIAGIWIHSTKCLLCGCNTMDAVAGGNGGCGCLIGCYDKAIESLRRGGHCPYCSAKLVEIVKTYVGGVF